MGSKYSKIDERNDEELSKAVNRLCDLIEVPELEDANVNIPSATSEIKNPVVKTSVISSESISKSIDAANHDAGYLDKMLQKKVSYFLLSMMAKCSEVSSIDLLGHDIKFYITPKNLTSLKAEDVDVEINKKDLPLKNDDDKGRNDKKVGETMETSDQ